MPRRWTHWTLLLITACGGTPPPGPDVAEAPLGSEPSASEPSVSEPSTSEPSAPRPAATLDDLPRCAARAEAVPGLDPAPSVHPVGAATTLTSVAAASPRGAPIGGAVYGFVWWRSANGRFALLTRFGTEAPAFGHHGEVAPGRHEFWLVDGSDGSHETISEMVAAAPSAIAYRDTADRVWILQENGQRTDLSALGADTREDTNRCLDRRQVAFDATGTSASWLARDPNRVVVQDLASGARCQVESGPGEIWRARPLAIPGWVLIREIPTDSDGDGQITFPMQRTSCACRWCNRFALSMGFYGWGGDAFQSVVVTPDGARLPLDTEIFAVGDDTVARLDHDARAVDLVDVAGEPVPIPTGCTLATVAPGAPSVLLRCGDESRLFFPDGARVLALPARVEATARPRPHVTAEGHVWTAVRSSTDSGRTWNIGRLRMNDGRIETGPVITALVGVDGDWAIGRQADGVALLNLASAASHTAALTGIEQVHGLTVTLENHRTALLGPTAGRVAIVEGPTGLADGEGCMFAPASQNERGVELGPWQLICP